MNSFSPPKLSFFYKIRSRFLKISLNFTKILIDLILIILALPLSIFLRFGTKFFSLPYGDLVNSSLCVGVIGIVIFIINRMDKPLWRYTSTHDLIQVVKVVSITTLVFTPIFILAFPSISFPRSIPLIYGLILLLFISGIRILCRLYKESSFLNKDLITRIPALLMYTGDETENFLRYLRRDKTNPYEIVGIIDPDTKHYGMTIHGVKVLGGIQDLSEIIKYKVSISPKLLILTSDSIRGWTIRDILDIAEKNSLEVARIPLIGNTDFTENNSIIAKPISIEDLLGRTQFHVDSEPIMNFVSNKCVLITGAGGSIGSELVRQVMNADPREIILVDQCEFFLFQIHKEISKRFPHAKIQAVIGDVRDSLHIKDIITTYQPNIVFHSAALKHVTLVEENVNEGVLTNIIGTRNVADACILANVQVMVQISTDKAVNPTCAMGATKRLAEMYCQALDTRASNSSTKFIIVRFGNVLGSSGSVIPLFQEQIAQGGPVTVTDRNVTRYFMSISEAVKLVLLSAVVGSRPNAKVGQIFVLDMGQPVKILSLAHQMIELHKSNTHKNIEIVFTGLKAGEKMHEELFEESEDIMSSGYDGLFLALSTPMPLPDVTAHLKELEKLARDRLTNRIMAKLKNIVPNYSIKIQNQPLSLPLSLVKPHKTRHKS